MTADTPILIFSRAPEVGQTKRRLIPALGAAGAARLHAGMLCKTVATAVDSQTGPVQLWCTPSVHHPCFVSLQAAFPLTLHCQKHGSLGRRMEAAFQQTFKEYSRAVLVGSDCPFFTSTDFQTAARHLATGCEVVLGPARDGGYVLIALAGSLPPLFQGIRWGTSEVLNTTRQRLRTLGKVWQELPPRSDIDRPEDLDLLEQKELLQLLMAAPLGAEHGDL